MQIEFLISVSLLLKRSFDHTHRSYSPRVYGKWEIDGLAHIAYARDLIYKKNQPLILKQVIVNVFGLGYLGIEKDFPRQTSSIPNRKKRNMLQLSEEQKEYNKSHSQKRIVIEQ